MWGNHQLQALIITKRSFTEEEFTAIITSTVIARVSYAIETWGRYYKTSYINFTLILYQKFTSIYEKLWKKLFLQLMTVKIDFLEWDIINFNNLVIFMIHFF